MRKLTHHMRHYIPLLGILAAVFAGFYLFRYDRNLQLALIIAASVSYVFWGIVHHLIHKDLTSEIVLEYIAVALLGSIMIFTIIFRA